MTLRLQAPGAVLEVDPDDGGRWTGLQVGGLELLAAVSEPGAYPPTLSGCFPMAPYAGRTREGRLEVDGVVHRLPVTAPPHAIHGTVLDVGWDVVARDGSTVELETALGPRWPWAGRVRQRLALSADRLVAELEVVAEQDMPVVSGLHPWFRRSLGRGGPGHLVVQGGRQYLRGPDGTPTGELADPLPGPWDDCFVDLAAPPVVRWDGVLEVELRSSARHWVLFDERPDALCAEPQTGPPDAVRLGEAAQVRAGTSLLLRVELLWRALG